MCVPLLGQTEIWRRADIIVPLILSSYIIISELVAVPSRASQGIFEVESHDLTIANCLCQEVKTKMANSWTQFQPWQNQPLPPGWETKFDGNIGR